MSGFAAEVFLGVGSSFAGAAGREQARCPLFAVARFSAVIVFYRSGFTPDARA